jgi:sugar O-acyltransferase (sialic acid O-acetyltransferase NeuD family)
MATSDLLVLGGGGHAKVLIATARAAGIPIAGVLDDDPARIGTAIGGVSVIGDVSETSIAQSGATTAIIAVGDNQSRRRLAQRFDGRLAWATVVHPTAVVAPDVTLGAGSVVCAGVIVQPATSIEAHVILNTACSVDHDCRIGAFAHIAPGSHLAGSVTVDEGALLGIGTCVIPGRRIGAWAVVGAGSVVVHDIPARVTAKGVPARHA